MKNKYYLELKLEEVRNELLVLRDYSFITNELKYRQHVLFDREYLYKDELDKIMESKKKDKGCRQCGLVSQHKMDCTEEWIRKREKRHE